jgi:hypothetical protein
MWGWGGWVCVRVCKLGLGLCESRWAGGCGGVLAVVGKLLLKSNCVTLLPLLLKETSYFESVTHFSM